MAYFVLVCDTTAWIKAISLGCMSGHRCSKSRHSGRGTQERKFLRLGGTGCASSKEARLLGRAASPCQDSTCRAGDGFIHHIAILVDADTDALVKGTVVALDKTPRGLHLPWCGHERLVDDRHLGGMDRPAAVETDPATSEASG